MELEDLNFWEKYAYLLAQLLSEYFLPYITSSDRLLQGDQSKKMLLSLHNAWKTLLSDSGPVTANEYSVHSNSYWQ